MHPADQPRKRLDHGTSRVPAAAATMDDALSQITWSLTHDTFAHGYSDTYDITSDENPTPDVQAFHDALYNALLVIFALTYTTATQTPLTTEASHLLDAFEVSFRALLALPGAAGQPSPAPSGPPS